MSKGHRNPGVMNRLEEDYAQYLQDQVTAGVIKEFGYESITFKLAKDTRYTPDFYVLQQNDEIVFVETKGFMRDDAWVKLKIAADKFPFRFFLVKKVPKKSGGGWSVKEVV